jgi:hypothetical protein
VAIGADFSFPAWGTESFSLLFDMSGWPFDAFLSLTGLNYWTYMGKAGERFARFTLS